LSYNSIRKIENLAHLVKLVKLYLCSNKIQAIEGVDTLVNLTLLELGGNRIRVRSFEPVWCECSERCVGPSERE
jgi:Leucine-rich repeat (LRR) protein